MEQTSERRKIKFICLQCDTVFDRAQRLQDHQNKKSCSTTCTRCKRKFRDRSRLENHQKHPVYNDCDICDLQFCDPNDYRDHQRAVHGVILNQCSYCLKEFSKHSDLVHHQKNAVPIVCSECKLKFCRRDAYVCMYVCVL